MRYAVVGASKGTGKAIVDLLVSGGHTVRAISRHPQGVTSLVEPVAADVTDPQSIAQALQGQFDAVFFTVEIRGMTNSRAQVRSVMLDGCVNTIRAAGASADAPKFVLLSVIGPDRPSWVWWILNSMKRGMKSNILAREEALKSSGLSYVICRAPKLGDGPGGNASLGGSACHHKLDMKMGIDRVDLARVLVAAAQNAPARTSWDVFAGSDAPPLAWLR